MHNIAILGFFSIVIVFFFGGRNDFGLKPTPKKSVASKTIALDEEIKFEEANN
tara:strand:- start:122 stop:280 length:159 start_codon:yes stop_codon:yes gene_type:complete